MKEKNNMFEAEIKSLTTIKNKLQKKYDEKPDQTLGSALTSLELLIRQLS